MNMPASWISITKPEKGVWALRSATRACTRLRTNRRLCSVVSLRLQQVLAICLLCGLAACRKGSNDEISRETEWVEHVTLARTAIAVSHEPDRPGDDIYQVTWRFQIVDGNWAQYRKRVSEALGGRYVEVATSTEETTWRRTLPGDVWTLTVTREPGSEHTTVRVSFLAMPW